MNKCAFALSLVAFIFSCSTKPKQEMPISIKPRPTATAVKEEQIIPQPGPTYEGKKNTKCTRRNDTRIISLVDNPKPAPGSEVCRVIYKKFNSSEIAAEAKVQKSHCQKVYTNIIENLRSAGYKCEDI